MPKLKQHPILFACIGSLAILLVVSYVVAGMTGFIQTISGIAASVIGIGSLTLLVSMLSPDAKYKVNRLVGISALILKLPLLCLFVYLGTWSVGPGLYTFFASIALVYSATVLALAGRNKG